MVLDNYIFRFKSWVGFKLFLLFVYNPLNTEMKGLLTLLVEEDETNFLEDEVTCLVCFMELDSFCGVCPCSGMD